MKLRRKRDRILLSVSAAEGIVALAVLVSYLIVLARTLRSISRLLGQVTAGVRAIESQTEPLGAMLKDITRDLEQAAAVLERARGT